MSYGIKYISYIKDVTNDNIYTVEIHKKNYLGGVSEIFNTSSYSLRLKHYNAIEDQVVVGSEFTFEFVSNIDDDYTELFESQYKDFKLIVKKNDVVFWLGYVKPENFNKTFLDDIHYITLTATDGLNDLKDIRLDSAFPLNSRISILRIIQDCLKKNDLLLDIDVQLNTFETNYMDNDELALSKCDIVIKRLLEQNKGIAEFKKCYQILEEILTVFDCRLIQNGGKWLITNQNELNSLKYSFNYYDSELLSATTKQNYYNINNFKFFDSGQLTKIEPVKEVDIVFQNHNLGGSLLDYSSNDWSVSASANYTYTLDIASDRLILDIESNTNVATVATISSKEFFVEKINDNQQLKIDFTWLIGRVAIGPLQPIINQYPKVEVVFTGPGGSQTLDILYNVHENYNQQKTYNVNVNTTGNYSIDYKLTMYMNNNNMQHVIRDITILNVVASASTAITYDKIYNAINVNSTSNKIAEKIIKFGDGINSDDLANLEIAGNLTSRWTRQGKTDNTNIQFIKGYNYLKNNSIYRDRLRVSLDTEGNDFDFNKLLYFDNKYYKILEYNNNLVYHQLDLTLIQQVTTDVTTVTAIATSNQIDGQAPATASNHVTLSNSNIDSYTKSQLDGGILNTLYYPQSEVHNLLSCKVDQTEFDQNINQQVKTTSNVQFNYVTANCFCGKSTDSETLDGVNSTSFIRSDQAQTKNNGNLKFNDNICASFGSDNDLILYHNNTDSYIHNSTGNLNLNVNSKSGVILTPNSCVSLFYDNSEKLKTTQYGAHTTGIHSANVIQSTDNQVITANVGTNDGAMDVYINFDDSNPTWLRHCYGGVISFYADNSIPHSLVKTGGIQISNALHSQIISGTTLNIDSNSTFSGNLSDGNFTSGFLGSGWQLDTTDNSLTLDNLTVRGTTNFYELNIEKIRANNGNLMITNGMKYEKDYGSDSTYLRIGVDDVASNRIVPFVPGDIVMSQSFDGKNVAQIKMIVDSVDATGLFFNALKSVTTGDPIQGVSEFVRIGHVSDASRRGLVYLAASDDNSPFIDVAQGVSTISGSFTTKTRLGRLDGVTDTQAGLNGSQSNYYGLYSDNVHLKGHIYSNSGSIGGNKIDSQGIRSNSNRIHFNNNYNALAVTKNSVTSPTGPMVTMYYTNDNNWGLYGSDNGINLSFQLGSTNQIAGWNFTHNCLYKNNLKLDSVTSTISVGPDANNYTKLHYTDSGNYGIKGHSSGNQIFSLGNENKIAGWTFNNTKLYTSTSGERIELESDSPRISLYDEFGYHSYLTGAGIATPSIQTDNLTINDVIFGYKVGAGSQLVMSNEYLDDGLKITVGSDGNATFDSDGRIEFTSPVNLKFGYSSLGTLNSNQTALTLGSGSINKINAISSFQIQGIVGGSEGKSIFLQRNDSNDEYNVTLTNESTSATEVNRIRNGNGVILKANSTVQLIFTASRWWVVG
jgi:hypothetical protein